jgi:hypothetical protein
MAMASGSYGITWRDVLDASQLAVDLVSDTCKMALVTNTHTPDFNAHDFYADITNEVANGNGYTTGGATLAGKTLVASAGILTWDCNDLSWTSSTFTCRGGIIWDDTVTGDPLIMAVTFGSDVTVTAGTLGVTVNASGLLTLDYIP